MNNDIMLIATKISGKSDEELRPLFYDVVDEKEQLKDNWAEILLDIDAKRISKLKTTYDSQLEERFNKGFQKAEAQKAKQYEKAISEKFGVNEYDNFEDLLGKIEPGKSGKKDMTFDDIKKMPEFLSWEKKLRDEKESEVARINEEYNQFKSGIEREKKFSVIKSKAKDMLLSMNPVLEDDEKIKNNRINDYLSKFEALDYEIVDDQITVLKDGKRVEDAHGNPLGFNHFVKDIATGYFKFQVQNPKGSPTGGGAGTGTPPVIVPKNEEEYLKAVSEAKSPEERIAIMEAFTRK